jgi:hypothetical protein
MKPENECQGALDAVLTAGRRPAAKAADQAAEAHLRDCSACRADAAFIQQVRHQGALYPLAGLGALRDKILRQSIPPATGPAAPAATAASGGSKALVGFLAAASLAGALWITSHLLSPAAVSPNTVAVPAVVSTQTDGEPASAAALPDPAISVPVGEPNVDHRLPATDDDGSDSSHP